MGWVQINIGAFSIVRHARAEILTKYSEIMKYVQNCGYYNQQGLSSWADASVADPWLIATAIAYNYKIVTFEQSVGSLSTKQKTKKVKIPDVANVFGVEVVSLFDMMRAIGIRI